MKYLKSISHVYGPYTCKDSGRRTVGVHLKTGQERFVSYPKFLVEVLLGRALDPATETVDHIDRDFNNNEWDNLRVLTKEDHAAEDALRVPLIEVRCVQCSKPKKVRRSKIKYNDRKNAYGPFCSRTCVGTFNAAKQSDTLPEKHSSYRRWGEYKNAPVIKYHVEKIGETVADMAKRLGCQLYTEEEILAALPRKKTSIVPRPLHACEVCGQSTKNKRFCSPACTGKAQRQTRWPPPEKMSELVWRYPTSYIANKLKVSDSAVGKYCRKHGIEKPPRGYWQKKRVQCKTKTPTGLEPA